MFARRFMSRRLQGHLLCFAILASSACGHAAVARADDEDGRLTVAVRTGDLDLTSAGGMQS